MGQREHRLSKLGSHLLCSALVASLTLTTPVVLAGLAHAGELPATVDSVASPVGFGRLAQLAGGSRAGHALDRGLAKLTMDPSAVASLNTAGFGGGMRSSSGEIGTVKRATIPGPIDDSRRMWTKQEATLGSDDSLGARSGHSSANADPGAIARAIKGRYVGGVKYCFAQARRSQPTLSGKVELTLLVGMSGRVIYAKAAGGNSSEVSACMVSQARRWQVEPPVGSESVQVAIAFLLR
jgi:hypothetical protein